MSKRILIILNSQVCSLKIIPNYQKFTSLIENVKNSILMANIVIHENCSSKAKALEKQKGYG